MLHYLRLPISFWPLLHPICPAQQGLLPGPQSHQLFQSTKSTPLTLGRWPQRWIGLFSFIDTSNSALTFRSYTIDYKESEKTATLLILSVTKKQLWPYVTKWTNVSWSNNSSFSLIRRWTWWVNIFNTREWHAVNCTQSFSGSILDLVIRSTYH